MRRFAVLACLIALATALPAASPAREAGASGSPVVRSAVAAGILVKLNAIRVSHGFAPLVLNAQLTAAAKQHTLEMLAHGYFGHQSLDGTSPNKRIKKYYRGRNVGENLLWLAPDASAAQAVNKWMGNALHRGVILDPRWREIGVSALHVAKARGAFRGFPVTVITADFGAPR